jgi:Putative neutral zinc metallopeptidase
MTRTAPRRTAAVLSIAAASLAMATTPALASNGVRTLLPVAQTKGATKIVAERKGKFPTAPRLRLTEAMKRDRVKPSETTLRLTPTAAAPRKLQIDGSWGPYATKLNSILYYVNRFWSPRISNYRTPVLYNDMRRYGTIRCGTSVLSLNNAWYCSNGHFITWDNNWLLGFFNDQRYGDMGVAALIAHEWGHATQSLLGLRSSKLTYSIWQELYADCQSGAWSADMARRGQLDRLGVGDPQEAVNTIYSIGDRPGTAWNAPGAHGVGSQRASFFIYGWNYGPQACVNQVL